MIARFLRSVSCLLCAGVFIFTFAACSTTPEPIHYDPGFKPGKDDMLTPAEQNLMIENARQTIIAASGEKDLTASGEKKLPPSVAEQVKGKDPEVEIYYHGRKYGVMRLRWKLPRSASVVMTLKGELLTEKPRWHMGIRATQSDSNLERSRRAKKQKETTLP